MKGLAKNPIYFSAYPLKAVEPTATTNQKSSQSPYLRSLLSARSRTTSRARVFPMVNPYKNPYKEKAPALSIRIQSVNKVPEDIELTEKRWFHNYE